MKTRSQKLREQKSFLGNMEMLRARREYYDRMIGASYSPAEEKFFDSICDFIFKIINIFRK